MRPTNAQSNKKYIILLVAVVFVAIVAFIVTKGRLDISMAGKTMSRPTDKEENLAYGIQYRPSAAHVLQRDGIVVKSSGDKLTAKELSSGITLDATSIAERSDRPIERFSEYVGYFYMYDGETLYRTNVDGTNLKATVKNCLKYEPMGDYIYSLKLHRKQKRLFRCSIIGTYEKMLFKEGVEDFCRSKDPVSGL